MKQLKLNIEREEKIVNKKIKEEFNLKNATLYGGYNLFSDYLASNGLDRLLEEELGGIKAPWATYPMPIVWRTLIDGYALGFLPADRRADGGQVRAQYEDYHVWPAKGGF